MPVTAFLEPAVKIVTFCKNEPDKQNAKLPKSFIFDFNIITISPDFSISTFTCIYTFYILT